MGLETRKKQERLAYGHAMGIEGRKILNPRKKQVRLTYRNVMGLETREIINPRKKQSDWLTDTQWA